MKRLKIPCAVSATVFVFMLSTVPATAVVTHGTVYLSGTFEWSANPNSPYNITLSMTSTACSDFAAGSKSTGDLGSWCYLVIDLETDSWVDTTMDGNAYFYSHAGTSGTASVYLDDTLFRQYGYSVYGSNVITGTMNSSYLGGPVTITVTFYWTCYGDCRPDDSGSFLAEMNYVLH